jgi:hypothetical protein
MRVCVGWSRCSSVVALFGYGLTGDTVLVYRLGMLVGLCLLYV